MAVTSGQGGEGGKWGEARTSSPPPPAAWGAQRSGAERAVQGYRWAVGAEVSQATKHRECGVTWGRAREVWLQFEIDSIVRRNNKGRWL